MNLIPDDIRTEIMARLERAEQEHSVRVLLAIESGSRAWGFPSPNSDYDVRFIYIHEPRWYQSVDLEERRDVIEYPIVDEIDINGWDIRKSLRLFWKSNPGFVEWIQSPITYIDSGQFRTQALSALPEIYAPTKGIYHYRSMAKTNYRSYLKEPLVRLKKYFYVLRPLLAATWIEDTSLAAPIEFQTLLDHASLDPKVLEAVEVLLEKKKGTPELGMAPSVPVLNQFIDASLGNEPRQSPPKSKSPEVIGLLNRIFHSALDDTFR